MSKFSATFEGTVFDVDLSLGGHAIRLSRKGKKWTGSREISVAGDSLRIEMSFVAPSFTDWSLKVMQGRKKIFDDDGTSDAPAMSLDTTVPV